MPASSYQGHPAQCARCEAVTLEEVCSVLRALGEAETRDMVAAFARVEAGTYGYCVGCHREIDLVTLSTGRFAERCTRCERARNSGRGAPRD